MFVRLNNLMILLSVIAPSHRLRFSYHTALAALSLLPIAIPCVPPCAAAADRGWDFEPYRIHALIALDLPGGLAQQVADELPSYLQRRAYAAIGPAWSLEVELAAGAVRERVLTEAAKPIDAPPVGFPTAGDKLLLVTIRSQPDGYDLTAREFDRYVERWGMPIRRQSRQQQALPEQTFALLWQAVAPLAQLELESDNEERVKLRLRGAELMRSDTVTQWFRPGDVFLPILRRTTRDGELIEGGIQAVPWTYVETLAKESESDGEDKPIDARVHSGTRRPFGVRRQGRVEQIAIALRCDPAATVVRLRSRTAPDKPLVGYEIFAHMKNNDQETVLRIGSTDRDGKLPIPPSENSVRTLYIKNGGQLLARLPVVPGAEREIEVPLPDDDPRLAAEARLAALREDLIDVVARRNILITRARQKMVNSDFAAAQKLLTTIDELPGRSQFNLTLTTAARMIRSDDPQIQRRIDQLFEATQTVLAQYLDLKPISQLHDELRAAQRKGT